MSPPPHTVNIIQLATLQYRTEILSPSVKAIYLRLVVFKINPAEKIKNIKQTAAQLAQLK